MTSAHDAGKAEADAAVLAHWKNVARLAREAGVIELADAADLEIARIEQGAEATE